MEDNLTALSANSLFCIRNCQELLQTACTYELIVVRLESLLLAISAVHDETPLSWGSIVIEKLQLAIQLLVNQLDSHSQDRVRRVGRPTISISISNIEYLLSLRFKVPDVAKFYGVSRDTIFRRLRENGISVTSSYTHIHDEDLHQKILEILTNFPNTGYKRMKGFLLDAGIKITDLRVRIAMRIVDPEGVYQRTLSNRAIVRRQYNVSYFNQLWHLDTNMKLIRWNIVIRSCIDGKTRLVVYLDSSGDNTAETNCVSFLKAVSMYGIPSRTRSDKGGENVLIARFMIEQRGTDRGSHICGRSVHNQRIERYWRDVFYGYTGALYNVFAALEEDGYLDVDNPKHIVLLHRVFLPRINENLETFRNAWNSHPISTERNYTPMQLMILTLPPENHDLQLTDVELQDVSFICNQFHDLLQLEDSSPDTITSPQVQVNCLSEEELGRLASINVLRPSTSLGYDVFVEAISCINV